MAVIDPALRGVMFVFLIIVLGLTADLIHTQDRQNPQVNFALFSSIFGILFGVFYGLASNFVSVLGYPIIVASIDFLDFVFTMAGATAVAAAIRCHSCRNMDYVNSNSITQGSSDRCRKAQATVAFLYFCVFLSIAQILLSVKRMSSEGAFSSFGGGRSKRSAPRTGVPSMSQV